MACDQCRKRKLKCDNVRPCESCRSKQLECTVSSTSRPPGRPRNLIAAPAADHPGPVEQPSSCENDTIYSMSGPPGLEPWTPSSIAPPTLARLHSPMPDIGHVDRPASGSNHDAYFDTIGLSLHGVDDWMASEPPPIASIQAPFDPDPMQLTQMCEPMDLLSDLVPSAVCCVDS